MPIKAYIGDPRQGKTYEVVTVTIYGSLAKGRRVVSNIAGLNREEMLKVFVAGGGNPEHFGELLQVTHEQVASQSFWLCEESIKEGRETIIKPGDVVALDEVWRFWGGFGVRNDAGQRIPAAVMNFFRMHGHFLDPQSGFCCEVALISQSIKDFHRNVKDVINETYRMTKLTAIGSTERYRIDIFQKTRITRVPFRSLQGKYDASLFCFYKSHSQHVEGDADPREENPDQRGNILKGALFRFVIPVGLVVFGFAVWYVYGFFHPTPKDLPVAANGSKSPAVPPGRAAPAQVVADWRVVGHYRTASGLTVLLTDGQRSRVLHNPPNIKVSALSVEVVLPDGSVAADWMTTQKVAASIIPK